MFSPLIIPYEILFIVVLPIILTLGMSFYSCCFRRIVVSPRMVGRWYLYSVFLVNGIAGYFYLMMLIGPMVDTFISNYALTPFSKILFEMVKMNCVIAISCLSGLAVSYSIDRFFMNKPVTFKQSFKIYGPRLLVIATLASLYATYMR